MATHRTTDGKPWVEPVRVPTDEDAKGRPMVEVRDGGSHVWKSHRLLAVLNCGAYRFITGCESHAVSSWTYCRFPTTQAAADERARATAERQCERGEV
jgi:hypothetical protein